MKYLLLVLLFSGCLESDISVGKCVRELGHDKNEKITFVTHGGAIETEWIGGFNNSQQHSVYENANKLIPIDCENEH